MKKRNLIIVLAGLAVLFGLYAFLATRPHATPETYSKAKAAAPTAACLTEDASLGIAKDDRDAIEMAAVSYLIDVPAGTNVDVKIATRTSEKVTGSDHYPAKYGNYNFELTKQSSGWVVTNFKRCN